MTTFSFQWLFNDTGHKFCGMMPSTTEQIAIQNGSDIKNDAWVTVNNDFLVTSEVTCQWFSRVTKSRVKIIGKSPHEWLKYRYSRQRRYYFIYYTLFHVLNTPFRLKQPSIAHFAIVAKEGLFCLPLWRHHKWSVTSRERGALALWRHSRRLFSHTGIRAKAIVTSE